MSSSSTAPSTPENKVRMHMHRSVTLPPKFDTAQAAQAVPEIGAAQGVETLFVHPHASIIKFSTGRTGSKRGLPWKYPTETTIAAGSLEIYRVPGSVSFLHSGTLLHAIMPRSQCWCVDGISKFAIRVLSDTYYRIELPGQTEEELDMVGEFKKVLARVMHYERTSCPFERASAEELPELEDIKNRRLRPEDNAKWLSERSGLRKTTDVPQPATADPIRPYRLRNTVQRVSSHDRSPERPHVAPLQEHAGRVVHRSITAPSKLLAKPLDQSINAQSHEEPSQSVAELKPFQSIPTDMPPSPPDSSAGLDGRDLDPLDAAIAEEPDAVAGHEQAHEDLIDDGHLGTVPSSEDSSELVYIQEDIDENAEIIHQHEGAIEEENVEPLPQHEDLIEENSILSPDKEETHQSNHLEEQLQEMSIKGDTEQEAKGSTHGTELAPASELDQTQTAPLSRQSSLEDPFAAIQARILARRSIGGTTLFYPSTVRESTSCSTSSVSSTSAASVRSHASQLAQQQNLASALVRKACSVFLGPPAHLVVMMLRIAARLANGTFGNMLFVESPSGANRRIPGSFEVSDETMSDDLSNDEDDFGVSLYSPIRLAAAKSVRERRARAGLDLD